MGQVFVPIRFVQYSMNALLFQYFPDELWKMLETRGGKACFSNGKKPIPENVEKDEKKVLTKPENCV